MPKHGRFERPFPATCSLSEHFIRKKLFGFSLPFFRALVPRPCAAAVCFPLFFYSTPSSSALLLTYHSNATNFRFCRTFSRIPFSPLRFPLVRHGFHPHHRPSISISFWKSKNRVLVVRYCTSITSSSDANYHVSSKRRSVKVDSFFFFFAARAAVYVRPLGGLITAKPATNRLSRRK